MSELQRLARRIDWLDRYRRPLALLTTAIVVTAIVIALKRWLPADWPGAHLVAICIVIGFVAWYAIETLYGLVLALWETDYASRTAPPKLPRAEVITRSRSRRTGT